MNRWESLQYQEHSKELSEKVSLLLDRLGTLDLTSSDLVELAKLRNLLNYCTHPKALQDLLQELQSEQELR